MIRRDDADDERLMAPFRALGWATFAAAPILLTALAVASRNPDLPTSIAGRAATASLIAAALAFFAATLAARGARRPAFAVGGVSALVVTLSIAFLVALPRMLSS